MNSFLMEKVAVKQAGVPADINLAGLTGARVKLDAGFRVCFLATLGDSAGATMSFTLKQHNAASGGTTKDLEVSNKYFKKAGAATSFTQVEPTVAAATYDLSADFAAQEGLVAFEVLAEDLDVNNGFAWVSLNTAAAAAAKIVGVVYAVHEVKSAPAYSIAL